MAFRELLQYPFCSHTDGTPYSFAITAEDDCILDANNYEILGSSEWLRVSEEDLKFMAHARQDIEDLLAEIERLKALRLD